MIRWTRPLAVALCGAALASCNAPLDVPFFAQPLPEEDPGVRLPPDGASGPIPARSARVETSSKGGWTTTRLREFDAVEVSQETAVWCWAACTEMILRYDGETVSQEEIAARIHGHAADGELKVAAASRYEVYQALSPEAPDTPFEAAWEGLSASLDDPASSATAASSGRKSLTLSLHADRAAQVLLDKAYPPVGTPIDELNQGDPAVAGLRDSPEAEMGHLYVFVGATYREKKSLAPGFLSDWIPGLGETGKVVLERFASSSKYEVAEVELVDPYAEDDPTTASDEMRTKLPFEDFAKRVDFVTTRADAYEILTRWGKVAALEGP